MNMPWRTFQAQSGYSTDSYRYGFNGQEKSNEIFEGSTTALFWEYDSRTGRRWNVDPVLKVWESPYLTFSGSPILMSDHNGDDADDKGKKKKKKTSTGKTATVSKSKTTTTGTTTSSDNSKGASITNSAPLVSFILTPVSPTITVPLTTTTTTSITTTPTGSSGSGLLSFMKPAGLLFGALITPQTMGLGADKVPGKLNFIKPKDDREIYIVL